MATVPRRVRGKTPVAPVGLHGQCKLQGRSKFAHRVEALFGALRRKELQKIYESERPRRNRPDRKNKPRKAQQSKVDRRPLVLQTDDEEEFAEPVQPPVLLDDLTEAPSSERELRNAQAELRGLEEQTVELKRELEKVRETLSQKRKLLRWHEEVRDWISSTGAQAALCLIKQGFAPPQLRFQGEMYTTGWLDPVDERGRP